MRQFKFICISFLIVLISSPALAGPYADKLSACISDNTNGKDRKQFAKLLLVSMAAHPEMRDISSISPEMNIAASQEAGKMVTRLLAENCASQAKAAAQNEGGASFQEAFGLLGKLAMKELMEAPEVMAAMGSFEKYIDRDKLQKAFATN